jgi:hypothetical protein
MHQTDPFRKLEIEDDRIDRPLGPQCIVDRHCPRNHRRRDVGKVKWRQLLRNSRAAAPLRGLRGLRGRMHRLSN